MKPSVYLYLSIICFILSTAGLVAQTPNYSWTKDLKGTNNKVAFSVVTDQSGNVYSTGYFCGTTDFDPGPATYDVTSVSVQDIFVTKMDALGNFVWAKTMGGGGTEV